MQPAPCMTCWNYDWLRVAVSVWLSVVQSSWSVMHWASLDWGLAWSLTAPASVSHHEMCFASMLALQEGVAPQQPLPSSPPAPAPSSQQVAGHGCS